MLSRIRFLEEIMETELKTQTQTEKQVTVEEVNRVLEVVRVASR